MQHPGRKVAFAAATAVVSAGVYTARVKPWMYRWGATADEIDEKFPGDELVTGGSPRTTRALTIAAPLEDVWEWLVQIGQDRAGFYSYTWLENLAGARMRNADHVHAEWQQLHVGDTIWLAERYGEIARQVVSLVEPRSHLVLMSPADFAATVEGRLASGFWGFYLRALGDGSTRLVVRGCGGAVGHALFDVAHFVMEQKMMRGIRARSERRR